MLQNIITSFLAFASTNVDDIFILMLFFGSQKFKPSTIIIGQYLGIAALVIIAFIGSYIGYFVDSRYIGLLGLFPIYLALKQVIALMRKENDDDEIDVAVKSSSPLAIAGVTIANGADNIGVYVPLFSTMAQAEKIQMITIFAIMTYVWCMAGKYLASHPLIARKLERYGHIIMPIVLLLLGVFILIESRSFTLVTG